MKLSVRLFVFLAILVIAGNAVAQKGQAGQKKPIVRVYYFHPNERCPIDQTIEENTLATMSGDFKSQVKEGLIKCEVVNTDDKANAKLVSKFEINAQALYVVHLKNGKEMKTDLTEFAFSTSQNNPAKFKSRLKAEILAALKP